MQQKRHSVDQVIFKLRKADVEPGKGKKVSEVCKGYEAAEQTYSITGDGSMVECSVRWKRS